MSMQPFKNGIKLLPSTSLDTNVNTLFNQEVNNYFLDHEGRTLKINDKAALAIGFDSEADSIGRTIQCVADKASGKELLHNSLNTFRNNKMHIVEENQIKLDGTINPYLSIKMPCYNESDQLFGIYGCSIILGKHPLLASLNTLSKALPGMNFSSISELYNTPLSQFNLSRRQQECLLLTIRGKTAKEAAKIMGLSYRTIEEYLNNIKIKMNVSSKSEMIDKAVDLLPPSLP